MSVTQYKAEEINKTMEKPDASTIPQKTSKLDPISAFSALDNTTRANNIGTVVGHPKGAPSEKGIEYHNPSVASSTLTGYLNKLEDLGVIESTEHDREGLEKGAPYRFFQLTDEARKLFDRFGQHVHLLTPTYPLFPEVAQEYTETRLRPEDEFDIDLASLNIPPETTLAVIVNPNNPNGGTFDMTPLPDLLERHPETKFLVDEAFIGLAGKSVVSFVPEYDNLLVSRTLSKAHSLAGFRIGYAVLPEPVATELNTTNDTYPLARPSQTAAIATLEHEATIQDRVDNLRSWTTQLAADLEALGVRTFPTATYFFLADFSPHRGTD